MLVVSLYDGPCLGSCHNWVGIYSAAHAYPPPQPLVRQQMAVVGNCGIYWSAYCNPIHNFHQDHHDNPSGIWHPDRTSCRSAILLGEGRRRLCNPSLCNDGPDLLRSCCIPTFNDALRYTASQQRHGATARPGCHRPSQLHRSNLHNPLRTGFLYSSTSFRVGDGVESGAYLGIPKLSLFVFSRPYCSGARSSCALLLLPVSSWPLLSLGPRLHRWTHVLNVPLPFAAITHIPLFDNILVRESSAWLASG